MERIKKLVSIFLALILALTSIVWLFANTDFSFAYADNKVTNMSYRTTGEEGTEDDPYILKTSSDLTELATLVNNGNSYEGKYFIMNNNISLASVTNWTSIGTETNPFKGNLNCYNYKLTGLNLSNGSSLFGFVENAVIEKLYIECSDLTPDTNTAVVAKQATDTIFRYIDIKVQNTASVTGSADNFGILVGKAVNCEINGVETSATVNLGSFNINNIGGIIGLAENSIIINCTNKTNINSISSNSGGIVGYATDTEITYCRNSANIISKGNAGGIAGKISLNNKLSSDYNNLINRPESESVPIPSSENIVIGGDSSSNALNAGGIFGSVVFENGAENYDITLRYNYSICILSYSNNASGLYGDLSANSGSGNINLILGNSYVINNYDNCMATKPTFNINSSYSSKFGINIISNDLNESTLYSTDYSENTNHIDVSVLPSMNAETLLNADKNNPESKIVFMRNIILGNYNEETGEYGYPMLSWEFFAGGNGTENNPYLIKTTSQMYILKYVCTQTSIAQDFNTASYKVIKSYLNFGNFPNVGYTNVLFNFSGHFDGDFNMFNTLANLGKPIFDSLSEGSIVENIIFAKGTINIAFGDKTSDHSDSVSLIVANNYGTIRNIMTNLNIVFAKKQNIGDIGGSLMFKSSIICVTNYGIIEQCVNTGNITCEFFDHVPLFGFISNSNYGTIKNCYNTGNIENIKVESSNTHSPLIAGITVNNYKDAVLENCYFAGKISFAEGTNKNQIILDPISVYSYSTIINCYYNGYVADFEKYPSLNTATSLYVDEMVTLPENTKPIGFVDFDENIWYFKEGDESTRTFYYPQLQVFKNISEHWVTLNKADYVSSNGNEEDNFSRYFLAGTALREPTTPDYSGYDFAGWHFDKELTYRYFFNTPVDGDVTLYAKWSLIAPEVTLKSNKDNNTTYVKENLIMTLEVKSDAENGRIVSYLWRRTDDVIFSDNTLSTFTVNALDEAATYYCYVVFTDGVQTVVAKSNELTVYVNKLIPNVDTPLINGDYNTNNVLGDVELPSGWTWNDDLNMKLPAGENYYYATYTPLDSNYETVTRQISFNVNDIGALILLSILIPILLILLILALLYLLWLLWFRKYTLYFVTCGGEEIKPFKIRGNTKFDLPVPTKKGMAFGGWYTDGNFYQLCDFDVMPRNNMVLYAKWYYPYDSLYVVKDYQGGTGPIKLLPQTTSENTNNELQQPVMPEKEIAAAIDATIVKRKESIFKRFKKKKFSNAEVLNEFSDVTKQDKKSKKTKAVRISDAEIAGIKPEQEPEKVTAESLRPAHFFAARSIGTSNNTDKVPHSPAESSKNSDRTLSENFNSPVKTVENNKTDDKKIVSFVSPIKSPINLNANENKVYFDNKKSDTNAVNKASGDLDFAKKLTDLKSENTQSDTINAANQSVNDSLNNKTENRKPKLVKAKPKKAETSQLNNETTKPIQKPSQKENVLSSQTVNEKPVIAKKSVPEIAKAEKTENINETINKTKKPVKSNFETIPAKEKSDKILSDAKNSDIGSVEKKSDETKKAEVKKEPILKKAKPKVESKPTATKAEPVKKQIDTVDNEKSPAPKVKKTESKEPISKPEKAQKSVFENIAKEPEKTPSAEKNKPAKTDLPVEKTKAAKPAEKPAATKATKQPAQNKTEKKEIKPDVNKVAPVASEKKTVSEKPVNEPKIIKAKPKKTSEKVDLKTAKPLETATAQKPVENPTAEKTIAAKPTANKKKSEINKPAVKSSQNTAPDKQNENTLIPVSTSPANKILIRDKKGKGYLRPVTERAGKDNYIPMDASIEKVSTKIEDQQVNNPMLIKKNQPSTTGLSVSSNKKYAAGSQTVETTKYVTVETTEYYIDDDFQGDIEAVKRNIENAEKSLNNNKENDKQNIIMDKIEFKD